MNILKLMYRRDASIRAWSLLGYLDEPKSMGFGEPSKIPCTTSFGSFYVQRSCFRSSSRLDADMIGFRQTCMSDPRFPDRGSSPRVQLCSAFVAVSNLGAIAFRMHLTSWDFIISMYDLPHFGHDLALAVRATVQFSAH